MTIFTSRTAESYDPEPWKAPDDSRWSGRAITDGVYDPRPEFEPTHDPEPWATHGENNKWRSTTEEAHRILSDPAFYRPRFHTEWAPRDRNRNRILIDVRAYLSAGNDIRGWDMDVLPIAWRDATPAEVDHARKVLTRLVNVYRVNA